MLLQIYSFLSHSYEPYLFPGAVSSALGGSVTITCRISQNVINSDSVEWYQQKQGHPIKLMIYWSNRRASGIPARFTGSGRNTDFTLTISGVQAEDAAVYYCNGRHDINSQYLDDNVPVT
uniref:Ig-like domain-containing protein n=1 Tax=Seriola dumerili TaxID=41447 RepID=A0A3B4UC71_SERDU